MTNGEKKILKSIKSALRRTLKEVSSNQNDPKVQTKAEREVQFAEKMIGLLLDE